jgi:hypothetical protein
MLSPATFRAERTSFQFTTTSHAFPKPIDRP